MIRRILLLGAAMTCAAIAKDPNQPVKRGSAEFSTGLGYSRYTGSFDSAGDYHKFPAGIDPALYAVPLRIRVGLGGGFEVKTEWSYIATNKDALSKEGFGQPTVGGRYIGKTLGVFANVTLPFATGDLDNGDLHTILETGGLIRVKTGHFRMTGLASYIDDFDHNEILRAWFRPEVLWVPGFSTLVTGEFLKSLDQDAHLFTVGPGIRMDFSEAAAVEVTTPITAAGRNSPIAGWSVSVRGLWTLKY